MLASFTLAQDNGVRVGSVIRTQLASLAQLNGDPADPSPVLRPALRVVGIVAAESEFPSGAALHYDLYATTEFAAAVNQRAALQHTYYARFARGAADLAGLDSRFRSLQRVRHLRPGCCRRRGRGARSGRRSSAGTCWPAWPRWRRWR